jgi:hypothetical protein
VTTPNCRHLSSARRLRVAFAEQEEFTDEGIEDLKKP